MGRVYTSRRWTLFLPLVFLWSSTTVLYGAGQSAKITLPANKAKVTGTIEVKAQVKSPEPAAYVVLVVDGTRPASSNFAPWTFQLDTREFSDGPHAVSVEAFDRQGLVATSNAITIYTNNRQPRPAVVAKQQPRVASTVTAAPAPSSRAAVPAQVVPALGPAPEPTRTDIAAPTTPSLTDTVEIATPALPHPAPSVVLNGTPLGKGPGQTIVEGTLQAGFRKLFAAAGGRIEWRADTRTARCVTDSLVVEVPVGSRLARVNGRAVDMGRIATIQDGRTVVPVRFFAQVTGSTLTWNARTGVASVRTPTQSVAQAPMTSATVASSSPAAITADAQLPTRTAESRDP